jgi:bifunctional UDP-N-acetylglucosamine pyrophosphorylase/glucosamine-1-phosphate N-acetyltransferase
MEQLCCVILAAGLGKRLGGDYPKALANTRSGALIDLALESLAPLSPLKTVVVVGHKKELIEQHLATSAASKGHAIETILQPEQLGTGHAVRCALPALAGFTGTVILTYADHPLFTHETLKHFVAYHCFKKSTLTTISFRAPPPNGYGRIVRGDKNEILRITEAKDCNPDELLINEVNSGVYAVDSSFLKPAIETLQNNNSQKEYYLTDIVEKAVKEGQTVCAFPLGDPQESAGVNTVADLAYVNKVLERRHIRTLELAGVLFDDQSSCSIDSTVVLKAGARVGPQVQLRGRTVVETGAKLEGSSLIIDSVIGPDVTIKLGSRVEGAVIGKESSVGPFANIRPGTSLGAGTRIGNFVEVKNAILRDGAKASHLTYLGDCSIGEDSNIGAGTITCNHDGYSKATTTIGKGVFIGSNSCLVAPVTVGDGALVAAGSVITHDVPADALALGRAKQEIKGGWAATRRSRLEIEVRNRKPRD